MNHAPGRDDDLPGREHRTDRRDQRHGSRLPPSARSASPSLVTAGISSGLAAIGAAATGGTTAARVARVIAALAAAAAPEPGSADQPGEAEGLSFGYGRVGSGRTGPDRASRRGGAPRRP
jgi:hypothetical protein